MSDASITLLGSLVGRLPGRARPAHALVERVTVLVVAREGGDRRRKFRPSQYPIVAGEVFGRVVPVP
ncbi:hypothetical protein AMK13_36595 [Streptomyces sp. CB02056]|nr:hypothetical protein AMK13_36595 [Streptomyces sp. CB02056]